MRATVDVVVGHPADRLAAHLQRRAHQWLGPGRLEDPLLGEDADLQIDRPRVLPLERDDRLHAPEPHDGIDLDVGAHDGRAAADRHLQGAPRPTLDVLERERALGLGSRTDHALDGGRSARRPGAEQRLVEVEVRLDETGDDEPARGENLVGASLGDARRDPRDPSVGDADVHGADAARQPGAADHQVHDAAPAGERTWPR